MTERTPVAEESLAEGATATPWAVARERLENPERDRTYWLATVRPDGRPHVVPLLGLWLDGAFYFVAGETTRKGKNLASDPRCVLTGSSTALPALDVIVEGDARKVTDEANLHRVAEAYGSKMDWPLEVRDGGVFGPNAPTAGPPPYAVYESMNETPPRHAAGDYAPVNGLQVYYEIHGSAPNGHPPLVALHGAYMTIGTMGPVVPALAQTRQVIAVELQGHGHTADVDRPLRYELMADDIGALLRHLEIDEADLFGYSMGGGVALQLAIRHPALVRKLVLVSANYRSDGYYPELLAAIQTITPDVFAGSPLEAAYLRNAPNPGDWPTLIEKLKQLDAEEFAWPAEDVAAIVAPALVMIGDSDGVRPEHAVELFRLLGGGVPGDLAGLPKARLAVLPGTTHITVVECADWLGPMVEAFLDAPMPEAG